MLEFGLALTTPRQRWFSRTEGVSLASLGDRWAAHSPLAGTSHLLNEETAAILLALTPQAPVSDTAVCSTLASEWEESAETIGSLVAPMWDQLVSSGLVTEHGPPGH